MAVAVVIYLLLWAPLVFAGRYLGRRWGNPEAGVWLPALLGVLGFVMLLLELVTDGQREQRAAGRC